MEKLRGRQIESAKAEVPLNHGLMRRLWLSKQWETEKREMEHILGEQKFVQI